MTTIRRLHTVAEAELQQLAEVLMDCVAGGASVGFMQPLAPERARAFWRGVAPRERMRAISYFRSFTAL